MAGLIPFNRKRRDLMNIGFDDFSNMIDDFFSGNWPAYRNLAGDTFKIDIREGDGVYTIDAELPGVRKDLITVTLEDNRLRIAVRNEEITESAEENYVHRERKFSHMSRCMYLADADEDGVKARLKDGLLTVTVAKTKKPDTKARQISIE